MFYFKKGLILLMAALMCAFWMVGCHKQEIEKKPEETIAIPSAEEVVVNEKEDFRTIEKQVQIIEENRSIWERENEYSEFQYAVTDLDHNGRLEVIRSVLEGSGLYTYTDIYEVNEVFDGLTECVASWGDGESQPDLLVSVWETYYDSTENTYHYILEDALRDGMAASIESQWDYVLKNGKIEAKVLAYKNNVMDLETFEVSSSYENADGQKITEQEYESIVSNLFSEMEKTETHIEWVTLTNKETLQKSYQQFHVESTENDVH